MSYESKEQDLNRIYEERLSKMEGHELEEKRAMIQSMMEMCERNYRALCKTLGSFSPELIEECYADNPFYDFHNRLMNRKVLVPLSTDSHNLLGSYTALLDIRYDSKQLKNIEIRDGYIKKIIETMECDGKDATKLRQRIQNISDTDYARLVKDLRNISMHRQIPVTIAKDSSDLNLKTSELMLTISDIGYGELLDVNKRYVDRTRIRRPVVGTWGVGGLIKISDYNLSADLKKYHSDFIELTQVALETIDSEYSKEIRRYRDACDEVRSEYK